MTPPLLERVRVAIKRLPAPPSGKNTDARDAFVLACAGSVEGLAWALCGMIENAQRAHAETGSLVTVLSALTPDEAVEVLKYRDPWSRHRGTWRAANSRLRELMMTALSTMPTTQEDA